MVEQKDLSPQVIYDSESDWEGASYRPTLNTPLFVGMMRMYGFPDEEIAKQHFIFSREVIEEKDQVKLGDFNTKTKAITLYTEPHWLVYCMGIHQIIDGSKDVSATLAALDERAVLEGGLLENIDQFKQALQSRWSSTVIHELQHGYDHATSGLHTIRADIAAIATFGTVGVGIGINHLTHSEWGLVGISLALSAGVLLGKHIPGLRERIERLAYAYDPAEIRARQAVKALKKSGNYNQLILLGGPPHQ